MLGTPKTKGPYNDGFILSEGYRSRSRANVMLADGENLQPGTVLGQDTTTSEFKILDPAAGDGSEVAKAVLLKASHADGAALEVAVIDTDAEVIEALLVWATGVTDAQKQTAYAQLGDAGIKVRPSA